MTLEDWTRIVQETASNVNLAIVGKAKGLDSCVVLNPGTTSVTDSVMATTIEAIIGAVELDGGRAAAGEVIEGLGLSHDLLNLVTSTTLLPFHP